VDPVDPDSDPDHCQCGNKFSFVDQTRTSILDVMMSVLQLVIGLNMSQVISLLQSAYSPPPTIMIVIFFLTDIKS